MHKGSMLGILLGLISGEKETPTTNALSVAAGNMLARDLRDMADDQDLAVTERYIIVNSRNGLVPGTIVVAPSTGSLFRDMVGEYVGVEESDPERVIIEIDGVYHNFHESMVKAT